MLRRLIRTGTQPIPALLVASGMAVATLSAPVGARADSSTGLLTLDVRGIARPQGQVCVALFTSAKGFPGASENALRSQCLPASGASTEGVLSLTLSHLPVGRFAAAVFHDENGDGKLNTGIFGIPKEDFGFTGNPTVRMGAPSFDECSFELGTQDLETRIALKSFRLMGGSNRHSTNTH